MTPADGLAATIPADAVLAVGTFDGVHAGHQQLLREMRAFARAAGRPAAILTFSPDPLTFLKPDLAPGRICDTAALTALLTPQADPACLVLQPFTADLARLSAEAFADALRGRTLFCGADWRFGAGAAGDPDFLRERGLEVHVVPYATCAAGERISSTRIRAALAAGDFETVTSLLGRPWSFTQVVTRGRGLAGPAFNVPTANLDFTGRAGETLAAPAFGVYCAEAVRAAEPDRRYRAVVNLGTAPTIKDAPHPLAEAHLLDFTGELYGEEVTLSFPRNRLRAEQTFPSLDCLRQQILADIQACREAP